MVGGMTVGGDEVGGFRATGARTVRRYVTEGGKEAGESGGDVACGQVERWKKRVARAAKSGDGMGVGVGGGP